MNQKQNVVRAASILIPVSGLLLAAFSLGACGDRTPAPSTVPVTKSAPPNTVSTSTPTPTTPVIPPGTGEDVSKKGTSTGMIGGESGTVASSGKPGTGTDSGAGTGAAESSDSKTADKK